MSVKKRKIRDSHISLESLNPEEEKKLLDNELLKNAEAKSDVDLKSYPNILYQKPIKLCSQKG